MAISDLLKSKRTRLDPTLMESNMKRYEKNLTKLVKAAGREIVKELKLHNDTPNGYRVDILTGRLEEVIKTMILDPAKPIIDKQVVVTYKAGQARAEQFLYAAGYVAPVGVDVDA